jgi:hypothetical protein
LFDRLHTEHVVWPMMYLLCSHWTEYSSDFSMQVEIRTICLSCNHNNPA